MLVNRIELSVEEVKRS